MRASQEKALQALQDYTLAHYPDSPAKFGELLLRIPELQRTCQVKCFYLLTPSLSFQDSFCLHFQLFYPDYLRQGCLNYVPRAGMYSTTTEEDIFNEVQKTLTSV